MGRNDEMIVRVQRLRNLENTSLAKDILIAQKEARIRELEEIEEEAFRAGHRHGYEWGYSDRGDDVKPRNTYLANIAWTERKHGIYPKDKSNQAEGK